MKPAAYNKKQYEETDNDKEILLSDTSAKLFVRNKSTKKSRKSSISKNTTKESYNLSIISGNSASVLVGETNSQNNIMALIKSLQDKIEIYEDEIKNLVDEKIRMHIIISNLSNCKNSILL
jgi:hypothetical protein